MCTNRRGTYITDSCSSIASHFKERVTRCLQTNEKGSEIVFQSNSQTNLILSISLDTSVHSSKPHYTLVPFITGYMS